MALQNDLAAPILSAHPAITQDEKADLWDTFNSKSPEDLIQHLDEIEAPTDLKQKLIAARQQKLGSAQQSTASSSVSADPAISAIMKIKSIPPDILDLAEAHPNVLKLLAGPAGGKEPKAGKSAPKAEESSRIALAQPLREDGQEHLPAIPDGHRRILASDGGIHDVPDENIEDARAIDPDMHVMNP